MCSVVRPLNDDPVEIRILYFSDWVQKGLRVSILLSCNAPPPPTSERQRGSTTKIEPDLARLRPIMLAFLLA